MRAIRLAVLACTALFVAGCHSEPPSVLLSDLKRWDAAWSSGRNAAADAVAGAEPDFAFVRMETFSCGGQAHEVAVFHHETTGLDFMLVPGGTFVMGSPETEGERMSDEQQHTVTLTKPFLICRTECTQAAWRRVMNSNPSRFQGDDLPVESVSWVSATTFCDKTGLSLPTEAQWEWACRAGTTTAYSFGDDERLDDAYSWNETNSNLRTHPVRTKAPNAFGLWDMQGNVVEWCLDRIGKCPTAPVTDPTGPTFYDMRVRRGGYWSGPTDSDRSSARYRGSESETSDHCGFRPVHGVAAR